GSRLEGYGGWGRGRGRRSRGGSAPPLPFIPPRGIWWGRCGRRSECSMTMDSQRVPALELIDLEGGGMTCASCAARVEKKLNRLEGVSASGNYATEKASNQVPPGDSAEELVAVVERTGSTAQLPAPPAPPASSAPSPSRTDATDAAGATDPTDATGAEDEDPELRSLRHRLIGAAILSVPVIAMAMIPALQFDYRRSAGRRVG